MKNQQKSNSGPPSSVSPLARVAPHPPLSQSAPIACNAMTPNDFSDCTYVFLVYLYLCLCTALLTSVYFN